MGYTVFTKELVSRHLEGVKTVIDLGAQNDFSNGDNGPYISEWYAEKGIDYLSLDISMEPGSLYADLSTILSTSHGRIDFKADIIVDAGTSEHIGKGGKFDWEAIYNCWVNKFHNTRVGGKIISENPKTGNWSGHGLSYYTQGFYFCLEVCANLKIIEIGEQAAMGNDIDGWNIFCVLEKTGDKFPSLADFQRLGIKQS